MTVALPRGTTEFETSWLAIQTVGTQLLVGCLRVFGVDQVKTGGWVNVGIGATTIVVSLRKMPGVADDIEQRNGSRADLAPVTA